MYRFVVERMASTAWVSGAHWIGSRDTTLIVVMPAAAVSLDPISVVTASRCPGGDNPPELVRSAQLLSVKRR